MVGERDDDRQPAGGAIDGGGSERPAGAIDARGGHPDLGVDLSAGAIDVDDPTAPLEAEVESPGRIGRGASEASGRGGAAAAAVDLAEIAHLAHGRIGSQAWDYITAGAGDETAVAESEAAFRRHRLVPRVLTGAVADLSTTLLGLPVGLPIGVASMALHGLAHPAGELASARAAAAAGAVFCLSTVSSRSIEAVAEAAPDGVRWFQLYVNRDREFSRSLVERAAAAGYSAVILTVDLPELARRDRDLRWPEPFTASYGNFGPWAGGGTGAGPDLATLLSTRHDVLTWPDVEAIAGWSSLPVVVKGVLHPDDARRAVDHGAAAVVVSNHGGRQLDRAAPSVEALPSVAEAVDGRAEVYLDGGVRRGSDVLIALGLGARAVFIGRPVLWGLAAGGEAGVTRTFEIITDELRRSMTILGAGGPDEVTRDHVRRPGEPV